MTSVQLKRLGASIGLASLLVALRTCLRGIAILRSDADVAQRVHAANCLAVATLACVIALCTIALNSPGCNPLAHPLSVLRRVRAAMRRVIEAHAAARLRASPAYRAWDAVLSPPHPVPPARRQRLEDLRRRSAAMVAALEGSLDLADVDALVLLQKTLGEVSAAYVAALPTAHGPAARHELEKRLDGALAEMVSAAEGRRAIAEERSRAQFDLALGHALRASHRLAG